MKKIRSLYSAFMLQLDRIDSQLANAAVKGQFKYELTATSAVVKWNSSTSLLSARTVSAQGVFHYF